MSIQGEIADAVVATLNAASVAGTFTPYTFTAARTHDTEAAVEDDSDTLRVDVFCAGMTSRTTTRGAKEHDVLIRVAVRQRTDPTDDDEWEALEDLAEQIKAAIEPGIGTPRPLTTLAEASWVSPNGNDPQLIPIDQHDRSLNQFTTVIRQTYRVVR